jgi:hypothetical protein
MTDLKPPPTWKQWKDKQVEWRKILERLPSDARFSPFQRRTILAEIRRCDETLERVTMEDGPAQNTPGPDRVYTEKNLRRREFKAILKWERPKLSIVLEVSEDGEAFWTTQNRLVRFGPDMNYGWCKGDDVGFTSHLPEVATMLLCAFLPDGPQAFVAEA